MRDDATSPPLETRRRALDLAYYVADLANELRRMALVERLTFLAYLLDMVRLEAQRIGRHGSLWDGHGGAGSA